MTTENMGSIVVGFFAGVVVLKVSQVLAELRRRRANARRLVDTIGGQTWIYTNSSPNALKNVVVTHTTPTRKEP